MEDAAEGPQKENQSSIFMHCLQTKKVGVSFPGEFRRSVAPVTVVLMTQLVFVLFPSRLKCQRTHPCDNCTNRGEAASCLYVGRGPIARSASNRSNTSHAQDRLQHLENLVMSLAQKKKIEEGGSPQGNPGQPNDQNTTSGTQDAIPEGETGSPSLVHPGKIFVKDQGTSYIDSAHWRAVLEEVSSWEATKDSLPGNINRYDVSRSRK